MKNPNYNNPTSPAPKMHTISSEKRFKKKKKSQEPSNRPHAMSTQLFTERLMLKCFETDNAERMAELVGSKEVQRTLFGFPDPYETKHAAEAIAEYHKAWQQCHAFYYAIWLQETNEFMGSISLTYSRPHKHCQMGYWLGADYWGKGYCTEAAHNLLDHAFFGGLDMHRVYATHLCSNPASGKVMQKLGMAYEGTLRNHISKDDEWLDFPHYGILKSEFKRKKNLTPRIK